MSKKSMVVAHPKQYRTYYHTTMQMRLFLVHDWQYGNHLGRYDVHVLMNMHDPLTYSNFCSQHGHATIPTNVQDSNRQ
jgi:hypothetical protein